MYAIVLHGDRLEMIVLYTLKCRLHFLSIIYILCLQNTIQINLHQRKANTKRYTSQLIHVCTYIICTYKVTASAPAESNYKQCFCRWQHRCWRITGSLQASRRSVQQVTTFYFIYRFNWLVYIRYTMRILMGVS